jgi:hypothetical protein
MCEKREGREGFSFIFPGSTFWCVLILVFTEGFVNLKYTIDNKCDLEI